MANETPPQVPPLRGRPEKADDDTAEMDRLIEQKQGSKTPVEGPDEPDYVVPQPTELISEEDEQLGAPEEEPSKEEEPSEELIEASSRGIDLKKIREKFADFAKTPEFKELRNAYYRESQYTELFPTLDDAREAAENNNTFEALNQSLVGRGDPTQLLEAVKGASPENFKKVAANFLDTLNKLDPQVYVATVDPLVRRVAKKMHESGRRALSQDPNSVVITERTALKYFNRTNVVGQVMLVDDDQPFKSTGVSFPVAVTWSNRTELIKGNDVSGHIGIQYDLDGLFTQK